MSYFLDSIHLIQDVMLVCITAVCIVLAAGSEIQANLRFNIFSFFAISGFHKGCTLGTLLATPPKVGVPVRHAQ